MQNNQSSNELIIARGIAKKNGNKEGQVITKLFFDASTISQVIEQLNQALANQQDGVALTLLEGEGKNGAFGMIAASPLELRERPNKQRAYTPPAQASAQPQAPVQQAAPQAPVIGGAPKAQVGGYKPKTPGYQGRK